MTKRLVVLAIVLMAGLASAQTTPTRRIIGTGPWWRSAEFSSTLKLSSDQIAQLDKKWDDWNLTIADLNASFQKESVRFETLLRTGAPDSDVIAESEKISDIRTKMGKEATLFQLAVRHTLTPDQWKQMQALRAAATYDSTSAGQKTTATPQ